MKSGVSEGARPTAYLVVRGGRATQHGARFRRELSSEFTEQDTHMGVEQLRRKKPKEDARVDARSLVRVENVGKEYRLGEQTLVALRDIDLNVDAGVFMAIAGPSGSGKSTLLNLIGCIDSPTTGRITID